MSKYGSDNVYFAAKDSKDTAGTLIDKAGIWFQNLQSNYYLDKVRIMWATYHGAHFDDDGHQIIFSGEQSELASMAVNHIRNLGQHMLVMVTSNRPSWQARSTNTDYKSLVQTTLANNLLDYYMREKELEAIVTKAVEYSIVLGSGFIKMEWNSTSGEVYDFNEDTGVEIKEGDVEFTLLSPLDVVYDSTKENYSQNDWVLARSFKNKYDLAAKYPEFEDEIKNLVTKSEMNRYRFEFGAFDDTDDVPVYEFYHKRTESMPDGRYLLYLDEDIVLMDTPNPYRGLPIYRISPADILGTPYGYTPLFDLLPLQDAVNTLHSTILTNQSAFGVQNIAMPRGSDVIPGALSGGLNVFEYNPQYGPPHAINFTQTPAEVFKYIEILEREMETLSGVNSVARGNPQASLESGSALALVQSMSLQFMSGLQASHVRLLENLGTGLINLLKDFASAPRVAAIVGKNNRTKMKEFKGDDLSTINRVIVDLGNPLSRTTAGRVQMAETLMQMKPEEFSIDQYFQVISTGSLDTMTEGINNEMLLIRSENEKLVEGSTDILALATDDHTNHIKEHKVVLADPDLRLDRDLVARTLAHIQEHINLLRTTDPDLLAYLGQPQPQPEQPMAPPEAQMPLESPVTGPDIEVAGSELPSLPTSPAPFDQGPQGGL